MKENDGEQICPHCGFDKNYEQTVPYLPLGTKLQNENYIIGKKIASNAEGARYIAYSNTMHSPVIISEFMPALKRIQRRDLLHRHCGRPASVPADGP